MLNLLPPEIKRQRRQRSQLYATIVVCVLALAVVGLALAGLFTWSVIQQASINEKQSKIDQLANARKTKEQIISQATLIEDRVKSSGNFQEKRQWEAIFNEVAGATPTDTTLTGLDVTASGEGSKIKLTIAGSTSDRRSIVLFRDKLEASTKLANAAIASLSETTETAVKSFTFVINADYQEKAD